MFQVDPRLNVPRMRSPGADKSTQFLTSQPVPVGHAITLIDNCCRRGLLYCAIWGGRGCSNQCPQDLVYMSGTQHLEGARNRLAGVRQAINSGGIAVHSTKEWSRGGHK